MLAGGESRRFGGTPKGLETVSGTRIVDRVATALAKVADEVILIANDPDAAGWLPGVPVFADLRIRAGGLAGVEAALRARNRDAVVVAWDMPFVTAALLQRLIDEARRTGAHVVVPESDSPYGFEPFCAYYSAQVVDALSAFLSREGEGGAGQRFLGSVARLRRLPIVEVARYGDPGQLMMSVNTAADLERVRARA